MSVKTTKRKPRPGKVTRQTVFVCLQICGCHVAMESAQRVYLKSFCIDEARNFFDLSGMEPGDVREFKITTEAVKRKRGAK